VLLVLRSAIAALLFVPLFAVPRLQRNELVRLHHWKKRNRLTPLNIDKRQTQDRRKGKQDRRIPDVE
jgi:hypothetical protein